MNSRINLLFLSIDYVIIFLSDIIIKCAMLGTTVGVNCMFDPEETVKTIKAMKTALDEAGLSPFLMTQPNGFFCPGSGKYGYLSCPEFPYGKC